MTRVPTSPPRILNAQGEQRDCAHTHEQDHQCHRVVVEPMPALYTHDAPRLESYWRKRSSGPLILGSERGRRDNSSGCLAVPLSLKDKEKHHQPDADTPEGLAAWP